jgi:hypothetical protein
MTEESLVELPHRRNRKTKIYILSISTSLFLKKVCVWWWGGGMNDIKMIRSAREGSGKLLYSHIDEKILHMGERAANERKKKESQKQKQEKI